MDILGNNGMNLTLKGLLRMMVSDLQDLNFLIFKNAAILDKTRISVMKPDFRVTVIINFE